MSTASQFFRGGGGLTMPSFNALSIDVFIKTDNATQFSSSVAGFWTAMAASFTSKEFETNVLSAAANTDEQTIVDVVSGSGVLTTVISPELSGTGIMTIRVTIDGVVTTFTSKSMATGRRFCIGSFDGQAGSVGSTAGSGMGSFVDKGYNVTRETIMALTPPQALMLGVSGMPFKSSLKVTIQGSVNITGTAELLKATANYTLSTPEGL